MTIHLSAGAGRAARWKLVRALVVSLTLVAVCIVALPATAHADTATLERRIYLLSPAPDGAFAEMQRNIRLSGQWYRWDVGLWPDEGPGGTITALRDIYLTAGDYWWYCAIAQSYRGTYKMTCGLNRAGSPGALLQSGGGTLPSQDGWRRFRGRLKECGASPCPPPAPVT